MHETLILLIITTIIDDSCRCHDGDYGNDDDVHDYLIWLIIYSM
jgi:hypothetical protein